ncbi:MAG: carboxymuconolactone decarboxylase family protein [Dehalococcoidia bacterium]|nr:carboxymuconolactone decarboxylase family protein [Dehalococcoidia bacterium]
MTDIEKQTYIDKMYKERGYVLDFHKVMCAEDFEFLKAYNTLIQAEYTNPRTLDAKTKELIYTVSLTAVKANVDYIANHVKLALKYGCTKKEILEALEICLSAAGVPAFVNGLEAWKKVVNPERIEPSQP